MKVTTNLKSGSFLGDAMQSASDLSDQVGVFFSTAEKQAKGITTAVTDSANALLQGLVGLAGF